MFVSDTDDWMRGLTSYDICRFAMISLGCVNAPSASYAPGVRIGNTTTPRQFEAL